MSLLKTFDLLRPLGAHLATDEDIDERKALENRPLGEVYPILYLDVLQFKAIAVLNRFAIVYENRLPAD